MTLAPPESGASTALVLDANVLIDFCQTERSVFRLVSLHLGEVRVPLPILEEEIDQLGAGEWAELGIVPVEPPLALIEAAVERRAGLSFHDHLCLLVARAHGARCVTNDGRLRRACLSEGIPVLWGLEMLALLVEARGLDLTAADRLARAVQRVNPMYINDRVIDRFLARLGLKTSGPIG
ncbi:MAG TPA: PIN domain-containing protein [Polyangia bacterium]|jgi:predicted nucleic acid-binding protein|nr:PIN domain-containing protein [Polyangia bacterium]